jgi:hypothetical protein
VMALFRKHFLRAADAPAATSEAAAPPGADPGVTPDQERRYRELQDIVCDEEALVGPADIARGS